MDQPCRRSLSMRLFNEACQFGRSDSSRRINDRKVDDVLVPIMSLTRFRPLKWLVNLAFSALLIGALNLSFGQQAEGGAPFFNDSGSLTLPPDSIEELQESMPELELFPPQDQSQAMPQLGDPLGSPEI